MDGNGRWAAGHGVPVADGHRAGSRALRPVVETAIDLGIESLAVYAFSTENWTRSADEVGALMEHLRRDDRPGAARPREGRRAHAVRRPARSCSRLAPGEDARPRGATAGETRLQLWIAFDYGGRAEIVEAARRLPRAAETRSTRRRSRACLYSPEMPDPDLVIRTSGELRVSNFLLWQSAYAEFVFTDTLWPDFGPDEFRAAIEDYASRRRRFGGR